MHPTPFARRWSYPLGDWYENRVRYLFICIACGIHLRLWIFRVGAKDLFLLRFGTDHGSTLESDDNRSANLPFLDFFIMATSTSARSGGTSELLDLYSSQCLHLSRDGWEASFHPPIPRPHMANHFSNTLNRSHQSPERTPLGLPVCMGVPCMVSQAFFR